MSLAGASRAVVPALAGWPPALLADPAAGAATPRAAAAADGGPKKAASPEAIDELRSQLSEMQQKLESLAKKS
jgi:hypothetical protein